jgi:hypothetical protein
MTKFSPSNHPPCLRSTAGTWGALQIVPVRGNVVLDLQTRNYDASGTLHRQSASANLPIATAIRLRELLDEAIEAALDRSACQQPGLWSDATLYAVATRPGRRSAGI